MAVVYVTKCFSHCPQLFEGRREFVVIEKLRTRGCYDGGKVGNYNCMGQMVEHCPDVVL
jgi:hypothetical protein